MIVERPGGSEAAAHERLVALGQMTEDVADLAFGLDSKPSPGTVALSALRRRERTGRGRSRMALKEVGTEHARTVGHVSRQAQVRVDERVERILARRAALRQARLAARRLKRP